LKKLAMHQTSGTHCGGLQLANRYTVSLVITQVGPQSLTASDPDRDSALLRPRAISRFSRRNDLPHVSDGLCLESQDVGETVP
jgi:hypothetical protein